MARCGIVITCFYAAVVAFLLLPAWMVLAQGRLKVDLGIYAEGAAWAWIAIPVAAQALLLFLSVDRSQRILRQRRHVAFTATLVGLLTTVLLASAAVSMWVALQYEEPFELKNSVAWGVASLGVSWLLWACLFYFHYRGSSRPVDAAVSWLIRGSVLELLVAVPSHIVVHRRHECTEPAVTGYGVVTGLALMLLAFGPGIMALYKKRIDGYRARMQRRHA